MAEAGDVVNWVARKSGNPPEAVVRKIYQYAVTLAGQFGFATEAPKKFTASESERLADVNAYISAIRSRGDGRHRAAANYAQQYRDYLLCKSAEPPEVKGDFSNTEIDHELERLLGPRRETARAKPEIHALRRAGARAVGIPPSARDHYGR